MFTNPTQLKEALVVWIRNYLNRDGTPKTAVIGLSGGKDSTVAAALCVEAVGADRVRAVLLPDGEQADIQDSYDIAKHLGLTSSTIDISSITQAVKAALANDELLPNTEIGRQTAINIPPRVRMMILYGVAQELGNARVVNTSNASERFIGWSTKYGDGAGDFAPLADLMSSEVVQIGHALGLPSRFVEKSPADGLTGKTDEEALGFTYQQLDTCMQFGKIDDAAEEKIFWMHEISRHKYQPMPSFWPERFSVEE